MMTMMSNPENIRRYVFRDDDKLLLDANVWLYIHGPSKPDDWKVRVYSDALRRMITANSQLYIEVLILSEFINSYARLEYKLAYSRAPFKQFRQSAAFKPTAQAIAISVQYILQRCTRLESGFPTIDVAALMNEYKQGEIDFNDQILADVCRCNGLKFVTHDGDFKGQGLMLVTANSRLLR